MARAIILMLDSLGVGGAADAARFGDEGANTLGHIAAECAAGRADRGRQGALQIPHLIRLGLGHAVVAAGGEFPAGLQADGEPVAAYGCAAEISSGKDTPSGHWELAGCPVLFDWHYFPEPVQSFPAELLATLVRKGALPGLLGNCHASGTEVLDRLGEEHIRTGAPIVYTSADSVFQIACHEQHFGLERLYALCQLVRAELDAAGLNVGRVIARPFVGERAGEFVRTGNRHDYAVLPPMPTLLDAQVAAGGQVIAIGKISDIYAGRGISSSLRASGFEALWHTTMQALATAPDQSLIFTNFVDFDSSYGHRRDVAGYAAALEQFDRALPELLARLAPEDLLLLTADHGCDPTWRGTEHTRECVPVLFYGAGVVPQALGRRESFADMGQSLAQHLGLPALAYGRSIFNDPLTSIRTQFPAP